MEKELGVEKELGASYSDSDRQEEIRQGEKSFEAVALAPDAPPAATSDETEEPTPAPAANGGIPDGGTQAWLQVLGSWVILVNTWGLVNSFGVFQTYYETDLLKASSSSNISWIGSVQASLLMLVGVVSGPLYDAGYFRHLIVAGLVLIVFGQFMTSLCTQYWQVLLAQGFCMGIGMGLTFLPSAAILSQYFSRRRALVLGISSSGSPLAGIVLPIIFSRLEPVVGFGWATRVISFVLLAISAVPVVFMRTRVPPSARGARALVDWTALRDAPFVVFVAGNVFAFLVLYVPFFYTQLFAVDHAIADPGWAPYLVTLLNAGSVVGRIVPNALADRLGSLNIMASCTAASAVLAFAWLGIHNLGGLIAFALLYGAFSGGVVSLTPSVVVALSPDMGRVGARMGMSFLATGISILIGTPIAGAILGDFSESRWLGTIGYGAAGLLLAALLHVAARFVLYRKNGVLRA
ncbi:putative major facilitator superfamily transporter protein [Phialemonium atrogriseum]|uniref:Major facilitator superfamily transporter protein n=1 Tax=Phialemonium atrogriseum TaxID=1093897 RepID=A0AAJ0BZL2_9PEZI|nr:putative major facilitator superfamily transporter protein [Phialemonium atrogriseum]KAK1767215.1 putative major facilitator superfamily transporter protein [Phialemonium atrogriseum]